MADLVRFIHTADIHLGAQFTFLDSAKRQIRKTELMLCCERIFSLCKANSIKLLLLPGDVFENNALDETIALSFLRLVEQTPDTTVVFAAGNHDPLTADSPFLNHHLPQNLIVFGTEDEVITLEELKVRLYGRSFKSVYMANRPFTLAPENNEYINILLLHGNLGADISDNYNPISKDFIRNSGMDYVALGHVHTFSGLQKEGGVFYAYSGCPEPHGFDEAGESGVICGEIGKGICNAQLVKTAIREHCVLDIDVSSSQSNTDICDTIYRTILEKYNDNADKNLYKISLVGEVSDEFSINTAEIVRRLEERVFFIKIKDRTEPKIDLDLLSKEATLRGLFVKQMLQKAELEPQNKEKIKKAIFIGLKAFKSEVKYREN